MGVKIRLGCISVLFLILVAAFVFQRPILRKLFDDAYAKTTEKVVGALPAEEHIEARALCADLHLCFQEQGIADEHAELAEAFRTASFDMLKDQEVTEEEARAHLDRVREMLDTVCR